MPPKVSKCKQASILNFFGARAAAKKSEVIVIDDSAEETESVSIDSEEPKEPEVVEEETVEEDVITVVAEATRVSKDDIQCPICSVLLNSLSLEERTTHVNECLSMTAVKISHNFTYTSSKIVKRRESNAKRPSKKPRQAKKNEGTPKPRGKPIPDHKILQMGKDKIAVDAFCYRADETIQVYLLSHFHSDHYGGMGKKWDKGKLIVATELTARLAVDKFGIPAEKFFGVKYDKVTKIPGTSVKVTCLDGNHCPGSGVFVLESEDTGERFLHCGDFRVSREMVQSLTKYGKFDRIYLDTTYLDPQYSFPGQTEVISAACRAVVEKCQTKQTTQKNLFDFFGGAQQTEFLVVVGTYSIGKERLAIGLAEALKTKLFCTGKKAATMKLLDWDRLDNILETDPAKAKDCKVHLAATMGITKKSLAEYLKPYACYFRAAIGISATGWSWHSKKEEVNGFSTGDEFLTKFAPPITEENVYLVLQDQLSKMSKEDRKQDFFVSKVLNVPYSEHSSFRELMYFVNLLSWDQVIPTVNLNQNDQNMRWIEMFKNYKGKLDIEHL